MTRWLALLALFVASPVWAQSGGKFEITRSTLDAGGSTERSPDNLVVRGTIGQPDVGASASGTYFLTGGFWSTGGSIGIFSDGFESGDTSAWSVTVGAAAPAPPAVATTQVPQAGPAEPQPDFSRASHRDDRPAAAPPTQRGPK